VRGSWLTISLIRMVSLYLHNSSILPMQCHAWQVIGKVGTTEVYHPIYVLPCLKVFSILQPLKLTSYPPIFCLPSAISNSIMTPPVLATGFPAPGLRNPNRYITGHNSEGEAVFLQVIVLQHSQKLRMRLKF
jgi:hypothetical protein